MKILTTPLKKRLIQVGIAGCVLLLLFILGLPAGLKYGLQRWLLDNGADAVAIRKLSFNPFGITLSLEGVDIRNEGRSLASNSLIMVNLSPTALFRRNVLIRQVRYDQLAMDIEQYPDGRWRYASYSKAPQSREEPQGAEISDPWSVLVSDAVMTDCRIHLTMPELDLTLEIDRAELKDFSTNPDSQGGRLKLEGRLNMMPIALDLDTLRMVPYPDIEGRLAVSGFRLDTLAELLWEQFHQFKGGFSAKGGFHYSDHPDQGMTVSYDGFIGLAQSDLVSSVFESSGNMAVWNGGIDLKIVPDPGGLKIEVNGMLSGEKLRFSIPGSGINIRQAALHYSGMTKVSVAPEVTVHSDGGFVLEGTAFQLSPHEVSDGKTQWQGTVEYIQGQHVKADGALTVDNPHYLMRGSEERLRFDGAQLHWQGKVGYLEQGTRTPENQVALEGRLTGEGIKLGLPESSLTLEQQRLELSADARLSLGNKPALAGQASLRSDRFELSGETPDKPRIGFQQATLSGVQALEGNRFDLDMAKVTALSIEIPGQLPLHLSVPGTRIENVTLEDYAEVAVGRISVQSPELVSRKNSESLLRIGSLDLETIRADKQMAVAVERLELSHLLFLGAGFDREQPPVSSLEKLTMDELLWSMEQGGGAQSVILDDLMFRFEREKGGGNNLSRRLQAMMEKAEPAAEAPERKIDETAAAGSPPVRIQTVRVQGKSRVEFIDHSLLVPFVNHLDINRLVLTGFDSAARDNSIGFDLDGTMSNRAPLVVKGQVSPFLDQPEVAMDLQLKNYPVEELSGYTIQAVGRGLAEGRLKLDSRLHLAKGVMDLNNGIIIAGLRTKTVSKDLSNKLDRKLPLPLDAALDILRDSKDTITLEIPVKGPLKDLSVGFSDILITALGNAIVPAAASYLMLTLGPYGALAYVGVKVGEMMLEVRLPSVDFAPISAELPSEHRDYLERIGTILNQRPKTDLNICSDVSAVELKTREQLAAIKGNEIALTPEEMDILTSLGQARAEAVQEYLATTHSIARDRLLICETEVLTGKESVSHVHLQL